MLDIIQNILFGISFAAAVGPVAVEVIKRGIVTGFWSAFLVGLGASLADATYLTLIYLGLGSIFTISVVKIVVWILGAIMLFYLGYKDIKKFNTKLKLQKDHNPKGNSLYTGYLIAVLSPMTFAVWFGIGGSILSTQNLTGVAGLVTFIALAFGVLIWFFALSLLVNFGRRFVNDKTIGYISLIAGIILICFGLYFGYSAILSILAS